MKKLADVLLAIVMVLTLSACSLGEQSAESGDNIKSQQNNTEKSDMSVLNSGDTASEPKNGKILAAFCTSASSGFGNSDSALRSAAKDAKWLEGRRFSAGASSDEVLAWADELGIS